MSVPQEKNLRVFDPYAWIKILRIKWKHIQACHGNY